MRLEKGRKHGAGVLARVRVGVTFLPAATCLSNARLPIVPAGAIRRRVWIIEHRRPRQSAPPISVRPIASSHKPGTAACEKSSQHGHLWESHLRYAWTSLSAIGRRIAGNLSVLSTAVGVID
jgi:hypothetical protein